MSSRAGTVMVILQGQLIMYCLWKTKGITIRPWREDVVFGAVQEGNELFISIRSEKDWTGKILFDIPRHSAVMKLPLVWPRINQFLEWYTVEEEKTYEVSNLTAGSKKTYKGRQMADGITLTLEAGIEIRLKIR